ncbi:DNA polymerase III subunit epsilon [Ancylobacter sp. A5.8]|uniref:DNA polymerase III subunit epsilon n=1 Tax=Ancylobacter gelatini TaxID=2919920 RepID=UPI001F4D3CED|nr:DNA polymerase III subunit epsilon [Ancylobacter gelatini]MCJ8144433.1 DNA polymerase III subunit epsilon [Ancylobacter gelatini]
MREIVLDTETTGLDPLRGDRLVELGCVEILNRIPTGQTFHVYVNPERDMPVEAFNVHGLSAEFLSDKPLFAAVADDFLAFIGGDPLVIHNAAFDIGFLNAELGRLGKPPLTFDRVVDTLSLARRRHPGQSNRLDDLMSRYGIDSSRRTKHGALLDSELLAEVYAELCGGRQTALGLMVTESRAEIAERREAGPRRRPAPLPPRLSAEELAAHTAFVASLGEAALWKEYTAGEA